MSPERLRELRKVFGSVRNRFRRVRNDFGNAPFREPVRRGYPLLAAAGGELAREGVRFHDLRPLFAGVERPLYSDTCYHLNREGIALLAQAIGGAIRRDLDGAGLGNRR